jgi:hypothetical protein
MRPRYSFYFLTCIQYRGKIMFHCNECGSRLPANAKICPDYSTRVKDMLKFTESSDKQVKKLSKAPNRWGKATQYQISSGLSIIASLFFLVLYLYYRSKALSGRISLENSAYITFFAGVSIVLFVLALVYFVVAVTRKE